MTKSELAKHNVQLLQGKNIKIRVNEGRNRFVNYAGYVDKVYDNIFTFKTVLYGRERILSYSYANVIAKIVTFHPADEQNVVELS